MLLASSRSGKRCSIFSPFHSETSLREKHHRKESFAPGKGLVLPSMLFGHLLSTENRHGAREEGEERGVEGPSVPWSKGKILSYSFKDLLFYIVILFG